jgi:hypothetical protein
MLRVQNIAVVFLLLSGSLWAQSSAPSDAETIALLAQQVKALQKETMELRGRVKTLEEGGVKVQTAPPEAAIAAPAPQPPPPVPDAAATEASPGPTPEVHDLHRIQWRGFGEADYKVLDQRQPELATYGFVPGSQGNFYTADFGLFVTSRLTAKASVLSEIVFEEADAQKYQVDLRRVLLKYDYNDYLKLSFGRYQTNIGYYNWAFRSAAWLQTTADRPLVMEFASNGGLLPTQAIGVSVTGGIPSGTLGLNYVAEYGSSDTVRPDISGDGFVTDENNGNQTNVGLFARPDWLRGLQFGSSYYHDQISNNILNGATGEPVPLLPRSLGPAVRYNQTIVNAYAVYVAHGIEFLNEAFLIRQALVRGSLHFDTPAFYSQFSKQLGPVRPFFRYQYLNANSSIDSIFNDVGLRFGPSFGARYDLDDYIAFKAQMDHTVRRGEPDLNGLQLQVAFTF